MPKADSVATWQRGPLYQPGSSVFDEHDVLVGNVFLLQDPAQLAKEILCLLDLRSVNDHQGMAVHHRLDGFRGRPGTVPRRMSLYRGFGKASAASVKKFRKQL